jgi:hypothetical protein
MANGHSGNIQNEVILEEHSHSMKAKRVVNIEAIPTDLSKLNPSSVLAYDGSNNMTTITKTISGVQYRRTLTYDGSSNLTDITAWVQL